MNEDAHMLPWDVNPQLTRERLTLVASTLVRVRHEVLQFHDRSKGDSNWSYGCVCYGRSRYAIKMLAGSDLAPWMRYHGDNNLWFCWDIEGVTIRCFSGDPDNPPPKQIQKAFENLQVIQAGQGELPGIPRPVDAGEWTWLIAMELNDDDLTLERMTLFQASPAGEVRNLWNMPIEDNATRLLHLVDPGVVEAQPVDVPPPVIGDKEASNAPRVMNGDDHVSLSDPELE